MNVLTGVDHTKKGHKLVGANIPSQVFDYLTLYSIARGKSKSAILNSLIEKWKREDAGIYSIQSLRNDIVSKLIANFKSQTKLNISEFKEESERVLHSKGLDEQHITYILKHLK